MLEPSSDTELPGGRGTDDPAAPAAVVRGWPVAPSPDFGQDPHDDCERRMHQLGQDGAETFAWLSCQREASADRLDDGGWVPAQEDDFASLATLIAGTDTPPSWLGSGLVAGTAAIRNACWRDARHPGNKDTRNRLDLVYKAAEYILAELVAPDRHLMRVTEAHSGEDLDGERQLWHGLRKLIARIDKALPQVPDGAGRGNPDPNASGKEVCAMLVVVAWREARGLPAVISTQEAKAEPPATGRSNRACNTLWELATGERLPETPNTDSTDRRWRDLIQDAKQQLRDGDTFGRAAAVRRVLLRGVGE